jgi:ATP-dependent RNA helicase DDX60
MTSTEKTRLQVQTKKQLKEDASDVDWWAGKDRKGGKLQELQRLSSLDAQIQETELLLRNQRTTRGRLAVEVPLYRLHLELRAWINHPTPSASSVQDGFRIRILRMIKEQSSRATPTTIQILSSVLSALGFSEMTSSLLGEGNPPDRALTFEFVKVSKKSGSPVHRFMKLHERPVHWLLRCFGEYMDRSLDSMPDSRVQFDPDSWQREVLDSLDDDASVLVVAPTSAGKTFISFYAMERVLRSSDDGILVYVAPTKALVTQVCVSSLSS